MRNIVRVRKRRLLDLLGILNHEDFHNYLLCESLDRYKLHRESKGFRLGSVMAVCANVREVVALQKYDFDDILITGITEPSEDLVTKINEDTRMAYCLENCESLRQSARNYDLVLCKEGIHHLARPILGVYEMLRVTKDAVIIIEPAATLIGSLLEFLGKSSVYEKNQVGNIAHRDNYVYRWDAGRFRDLLNSYYIQSGYILDITQGWMSSKLNANSNKYVRFSGAILGWGASFIPGSRGNYCSALILAGKDLPETVVPSFVSDL